MTRKKNRWSWVAAVALSVGTAAAPRAAQACGGFFCQTNPIDQSGEYILFSVGESGVRAYIQVQYQGKAEDFAWVVPVMSAPTKVGVGVQQVLSTLASQTAPRFQIDLRLSNERQCGGRAVAGGESQDAAAGASKGVDVLGSGEVGPYNYAVVAAKDAGKLDTWLADNGFQQPAAAKTALAHYVQQSFVFVAIKLKRGAEVGEIQPLVLDMPHQEACVPLVLTSIAAIPDMPIYVFVLGQHRAVPRNWFEVELNQAKIDWATSGSNYRALVTAAIDEAQGRAFVTEMAGKTTAFKNTLWRPGLYDTSKLAGITSPVLFVRTMLELGLPRDPLIQTLLRKHIPMPESVKARGVSEQSFYNALEKHQQDLVGVPFDGAAFIADLDARIVTPLKEAQAMLDEQPYLTRMFTTVSPLEMTRDPLFDFNAGLGDVNNVHTAKALGTCTSSGAVSISSLTLETGEVVRLPASFDWNRGGPWPAAAREPAAKRIALTSASEAPIPVAARDVAMLDKAFDTMSPLVVKEMAKARVAASSGGCAVGRGGAPGGVVAALAALALVWRRRARRGR